MTENPFSVSLLTEIHHLHPGYFPLFAAVAWSVSGVGIRDFAPYHGDYPDGVHTGEARGPGFGSALGKQGHPVAFGVVELDLVAERDRRQATARLQGREVGVDLIRGGISARKVEEHVAHAEQFEAAPQDIQRELFLRRTFPVNQEIPVQQAQVGVSAVLSLKQTQGLSGASHTHIEDPPFLFAFPPVFAGGPAAVGNEDMRKLHTLGPVDCPEKDALADGMLSPLLGKGLEEVFDGVAGRQIGVSGFFRPRDQDLFEQPPPWVLRLLRGKVMEE